MTVQRVVVVPKPIDTLPREGALATSGGAGDAGARRQVAARISSARAEHALTVASVRAALGALGIEALWSKDPRAAGRLPDGHAPDLVIAVGGDGTFLTVARHSRAPILGVNSSPSTSIGHYAFTHAAGFRAALEAVLAGHHTPRALARIRATIAGVPLPFDALNDVLFAHRTPVSSTRYALRAALDGADATGEDLDPSAFELQLSSGIWIATATGSSGAIHSAGGAVMAPDDLRLQWRVREPYLAATPRPRRLAGFTNQALTILSRSDKNMIFIDGHAEGHPVPFGAHAELLRSPDPLFAFLSAPGM